MFKFFVVLLSIVCGVLVSANSEPLPAVQNLRTADHGNKVPMTFQISYNKFEFDDYLINSQAVNTITVRDSAAEEIYNAPIYKSLDATGAKIGTVAILDILNTRAGSLYVTETGTYFADGQGFGSAITYEFSFLSLTGSGIWPAGAVIKTKSTSASGIFADKDFSISINVIASGVREVTITELKHD